MNWKIINMKRTIADDLVIEVTFEITANGQGLVGTKIDAVTLVGDASSPDFIPYNDLTELIVIGWVKDSVDVEVLEGEAQANLDKKIARQSAITTKTGLPWGIPFN